MNDSVNKLIELFRCFPGIGPRQAKRFVYFLLSRKRVFLDELTDSIATLQKETGQCAQCFRYFRKSSGKSLCPLCADSLRSDAELMVVATDTDLEAIEKGGIYRGRYFVLGGTLHLLEKRPEEKLRLKELKARVEKRGESAALKEIILALSANPDGEHTTDALRALLSAAAAARAIKITTLGRGLSTGSELEYADSETIKNALAHRG